MDQPTRSVTASFMPAPLRTRKIVSSRVPGAEDSNLHVSLHLEGNGRGDANVIFEGAARIDPAGPRADAVPAYIEKYREFIDECGWTPESFATDYPYVIRVSPTRARIW
jgi:hypothetical protein